MNATNDTTRTWIPSGKPTRLTPERPRPKPARGAPPAGPLRLPTLPPRVLPPPVLPPRALPPREASPAPAPADRFAGTAPAGDERGAGPRLSAAGLLSSGAAAYREEALCARLDLDATEFSELLRAGVVIEVALRGRTRYVLAEALERPAVASGAAR